MSHIIRDIETCVKAGQVADADSERMLIGQLCHADWRVRYAAAIALGERKSAVAVPALAAVLEEENKAPIYSQKEDLAGLPAGSNRSPAGRIPDGVTLDTAEAWRRRGRLKQAVCLALAAIGQSEDYGVRAASCKALGLIRDPSSLEILKAASDDQEWCTATEARKGVAALSG